MDKKEIILSTAMKLFGQKGFEGTSVREIAADAAVNPAMISYYFGSKENLFQSLVEHKTSYLKGVFRELEHNILLSHIEKINVIVDNYIERLFNGPQFHQLLQRELSLEKRPELKEEITRMLLQNFYSIQKIIQSGINSGEFKKDIDIELSIATIIGSISYLLSSEAMCRKILNKSKDFSPFHSKKLKERMSNHLKRLMRSHLLKTNIE